MALNGLFTDRKRCSDFFVAESLGNQSQNLDLTSGELGLRQTVGELAREFRRNRTAPRVHIPYSVDKLFVRRLLGQKRHCAGLQRLVNVLVRRQRRKDDDLRRRRVLPD